MGRNLYQLKYGSRFTAVSIGCLFSLVAVQAAVPVPSITIGDHWALVQEWRVLKLKRGEQILEITDIPAEADISSLNLRTKRRDIPLTIWEKEAAEERVSGKEFYRAGDDIIWRPGNKISTVPGSRRLRCSIDSPVSGSRKVEITYLMSNISWRVHYQVAVRGDLADDKPISVDLWSKVTLENQTSLSFENTRVYLVAEAVSQSEKTKKAPGFLMLNYKSPLAELWSPPRKEFHPEYTYMLPDPVSLVPRGETQVQFLSAERIPARRIYHMSAESIPISTRRAGWPLEQLLVFKNSTKTGLGRLLPSGPVGIYRGSLWGRIIAEGRLPHTPVNGEIRISMGKSEDVQGWRRDLGRAHKIPGSYHAAYELKIQNKRKTPVTVEIDEVPPSILKWEVISATESYVRRAGQLHFQVEIPEEFPHRIEYRIQVREPNL